MAQKTITINITISDIADVIEESIYWFKVRPHYSPDDQAYGKVHINDMLNEGVENRNGYLFNHIAKHLKFRNIECTDAELLQAVQLLRQQERFLTAYPDEEIRQATDRIREIERRVQREVEEEERLKNRATEPTE